MDNQQSTIPNDTPIDLKMDFGTAQLILAGLAELPAKYSRNVMAEIEKQIGAQLNNSSGPTQLPK